MYFLSLISQIFASYGVAFSNNMQVVRYAQDIPHDIMFGHKAYQSTNITVEKNQLKTTSEISPNVLYYINDVFELTDEEISKKYNLPLNNKQFTIKGMETEFYKSNIVSSFFQANKHIFNNKNALIVSKRDYGNDEFAQSLQNLTLTGTKVVPESLCLAAYEMKKIKEENCNMLIINTRGKKTVLNFYECKNEGDKKCIKKTFSGVIGEGDYFFDEIIRENVEKYFMEAFEAKKDNLTSKDFNGKIKILPSLVDDSNKDEYFYYDGSKIINNARNMILNGATPVDFYNLEFRNAKGDVEPIVHFKLEIEKLIKITDEFENHRKFDLEAFNAFIGNKTYKAYHFGTYRKIFEFENTFKDIVAINDLVKTGAAFLTNSKVFSIEDDRIDVVKYSKSSEQVVRQRAIEQELETYAEFAKLTEKNFDLKFVENKDDLISSWTNAVSYEEKKKVIKDVNEAKLVNARKERDHIKRPQGVSLLKDAINEVKKKITEVEKKDAREEIENILKETEEWLEKNVDDMNVIYSSFLEKKNALMLPLNRAIIRKRVEEEDRIKKEQEKIEAEKKAKEALEAKERGEDLEKKEKEPKFDSEEFQKMMKDGMPDFDPKMYEEMMKNTKYDPKKYGDMFKKNRFGKDMFKDIFNKQKSADMPDIAQDADKSEDKAEDLMKNESNKLNDEPVKIGDENVGVIGGDDMKNEILVNDVEKQEQTETVMNEDL